MEYSKMFVQYVCFFHSCIIQPDITPTGAVLQMCSIQWTLPIGHRKKKKKKLESKVALIINAYMHSFSFFSLK